MVYFDPPIKEIIILQQIKIKCSLLLFCKIVPTFKLFEYGI